MKYLQLQFWSVLWLSCVSGEVIGENVLPSLFGIDDVSQCKKQGHTFCEAKINLKSQSNTEVWKQIQESKKQLYTIDRDALYRIVCVPTNVENINNEIKTRFDSELKNLSLEVDSVKVYYCTGPEEKKLSYFQQIFLTVVLLYIAFVIWATLYGNNKFLEAFSLTANHAQLIKINTNPNFVKLKSMNGIRTVSCMLVVLAHTILCRFFIFSSNPDFLEKKARGPAQWFFSLGMFTVQPFFVVTGWLMMDLALQHIEKEKKMTIIDVLGVMVLRVLRLWPSLIFYVLLESSGIVTYFYNVHYKFFIMNHHNSCKERWWATIFFFSNWYSFVNVCCLHTWYLSADVQLCFYTMLVLLVVFKYKLPVLRSLLIMLGGAVLILMVQIYINNYDVILRTEPEQFLPYNAIESGMPHMSIWYTSVISNIPSFLIGMIFGTIYNRKKEVKYFNNNVAKHFCSVSFLGFTGVAIFLAGYQYNRITSAVLGSILKPIFCLGIAIGILGFSEGTGGPLKRIFEWRYFEFLTNITYQVYLVHVLIAFQPLVAFNALEEVSWTTLFFNSFLNIIQSFILSYILTLTLEYPWKNVINLLVRRKRKDN